MKLTKQQAKRVKMTPIQKLEYSVYLKGCKLQGVRPVLVDFLNHRILGLVVDRMNDFENTLRERARAAVTGR